MSDELVEEFTGWLNGCEGADDARFTAETFLDW